MNRTTQVFTILVVALAATLVCGVSAYLVPHIPLIWQISGGIAILAFIAYFVMEAKVYSEIFSRKSTRYGLNSVVMCFIALAITVVVNLIGVDQDVKADLTKNKLHSLSEQSIKLVQGLNQEIRLKAFINPSQMQDFTNIFDKYTYYSKKLKTEFIDVDKDPFAAQKYQIKQPGVIVVESDTRSTKVDNIYGADDPKLEEKLTNAIIQVAKGDKKKIYFVTGHGEHMTSDTGREGLSEIKEALTSGRYNVEDLLLIDKDKVPADAEIVVDAGPKSEFMDREIRLLGDYVKSGGKLLMMIDPMSPASLQPMLASWGVDWKPKQTVLETNRLQQLAGGNPLTPIVTNYNTAQQITSDARQMSIFPIPTPILKAATVPNGNKVDTLFSTSNRSLEVELLQNKVKVDEAHDPKGPFSLAVAVTGKYEAPKPAEPAKDAKAKDAKTAEAEKPKDSEFRVVVVGDSEFVANGIKKFGINADLFQNMLSWLAHEEDLISIRPRPTDTSEFNITETRARIINLASIAFFPFAMFLSGIAVWLQRRRR